MMKFRKIEIVNSQIAAHPLQKRKNPGRLMKLYYDREIARDKLHKTQIKYQKQQSRKSYYWEEFLNLIEILREFQALEGYLPPEWYYRRLNGLFPLGWLQYRQKLDRGCKIPR